MTNYATYGWYLSVYQGQQDQATFDRLIFRASRDIDYAVNHSLAETEIEDDKVRYVACRLVDIMAEAGETEQLQSLSIDGVSMTAKSEAELKRQKVEVLDQLPRDLRTYL